MNFRQIVLYGLLLMLVTASGWFLFTQETGLQREPASATGADAFVEDMDLKVMNEQGQLQYRIQATRMTHYPRDERFHLEQPDIRIMQTNGDNWRIKSERGETTEDADIIWLLGAVDIKRRQTATSEPAAHRDQRPAGQTGTGTGRNRQGSDHYLRSIQDRRHRRKS